ncbi:MAG: SIMPL domain-containing protein [Candidatus Thiodiazotropha sp.]
MRHRGKRQLVASLIGLVLLIPTASSAQDDDNHYDRISLQTRATEAVENDTLIAVMYAQREGPELAPLTDQVNRMVEKAVQQARQTDGIQVTTLGYQTHPVYQKQTISGWRVRQSIHLESQHSDVLGGLLGKLQSGLALESINYTLSSEGRDNVEERLILQAIDAFRQRASQVTRQMGRQQYRVVEMAIHTQSPSGSPSPMRARMMAMESSVAPPTLEGGTQNVQVEIEGRIELQPN